MKWKQDAKTVHAIAEIVFAIILIVLIYFLIRYMDQRDIRAAVNTQKSDIQTEWMEFPEEAVMIRLGKRNFTFSHPVSTYLFMGTDASGNEDGTGSEHQGSMADVLMLITIDEEEKCYGILQLNRDTITEVPMLEKDGTAYASAGMQLCTAHWYGRDKKASCENTVQTVSNMLGGLPITGYYALQMDAVPLLNQAVGGVKVTFHENLTELDPQMKKGSELTLTDQQAEKLLHSRYEMKDDRNSRRMQRQQIFMKNFMRQAGERTDEDPDFAITLFDRLHPYATEDINMNELTAMLGQINGYTNKGIFTIEGKSIIGEKLGNGKKHWEFYPDGESTESVMRALYPLVYSKGE